MVIYDVFCPSSDDICYFWTYRHVYMTFSNSVGARGPGGAVEAGGALYSL